MDEENYDDGGWGRVDVGNYETMQARLCRVMCSTCVFRAGNPMKLASGRLKDMVESALGNQGFVVCHSTLPGSDVPPAICRGFKDRYSTQALQLYERLFGFELIDPPSIKGGKGAAHPHTSGDAEELPG